jgi:hypothetical protein
MRVNVSVRLGNFPHGGSKTLVHYLPKGRHGFGFRIEEIFKEAVDRGASGTATTAGRGVFAHQHPILSFRFTGVFLLRLGTRTLSALLFHPPLRRTAWYGLALACGACIQRRLLRKAIALNTLRRKP